MTGPRFIFAAQSNSFEVARLLIEAEAEVDPADSLPERLHPLSGSLGM